MNYRELAGAFISQVVSAADISQKTVQMLADIHSGKLTVVPRENLRRIKRMAQAMLAAAQEETP